jgi:protein-arginine kinase
LATSHLIISRRKNYAENDYKEIIEEKNRYTLEKYIKVSTGILKKLKSISYKENNIWG